MSMPFSSDELLKKSEDFLNKVTKPACSGCARGILMCHHTPCIGTADEFERLLDAGYANRVSLEFWVGISTKDKSFGTTTVKTDKEYDYFDEDVFYLAPSIVGNEGKKAQFTKSGICNLLVDNKCSLHDLGLKPSQGKMACCKIENVFIDKNGKQRDIDERIAILNTWNTQKGKDLISRWKKETNFSGIDTIKAPGGLGELLEAYIQLLKSHSDMKKHGDSLGINFDDEEPKTVITYEKPY